jgi:hypothetical protein
MSLLSCFSIFLILEKYKQNERYLAANHKEIEKGYDNKFIAIDNEQIIGSTGRIEKLVDDLDRNNNNTPTVLIKLISGKIHRYMI